MFTSSCRAVVHYDRLGTSGARDRRAGSSPGAPGARGAARWRAAWSRARARAAGPRRRCRAACASARGPAPGRARGRGPALGPGPGRDLARGPAPAPAPTGSENCTSNRPASGCYPYPCDPCVCVYVCWDGRSVMVVSIHGEVSRDENHETQC